MKNGNWKGKKCSFLCVVGEYIIFYCYVHLLINYSFPLLILIEKFSCRWKIRDDFLMKIDGKLFFRQVAPEEIFDLAHTCGYIFIMRAFTNSSICMCLYVSMRNRRKTRFAGLINLCYGSTARELITVLSFTIFHSRPREFFMIKKIK